MSSLHFELPSKSSTLESSTEVLISSREKVKKERIKSSITANELRFDRLGLFGRSKEMETLKDCLSRVSNPENSIRRELVLIGGESGTGKSALARQLQRPIEGKPNGLFCSGKYDLNMRDQPFVGISMICNQLCQKILSLRAPAQPEGDPGKFGSIREELLALGTSTIRQLSNVFGDLQLIFQEEPAEKTEAEEEDAVGSVASGGSDNVKITNITEGKKEQLAAAMKSFFRVITKHFNPLVLFLDDLQWGDTSSLDCVDALLNDPEICIMIIGCYRSNEVDENHILMKFLSSFKEQLKEQAAGDSAKAEVTEVEVGNLSVDEITKMLTDLLGATSASVEQLADVCHNRTGGNVFFVKAFLTMLVDKGFLKFQIGTFKWEWDILVIEQETSATPNVVDIIQARMKKRWDENELDGEPVQLVVLASCLGNTFDSDTLRLVWEKTAEDRSKENQDTSKTDDDSYTSSAAEFDLQLKIAIQDLCLEATGFSAAEPMKQQTSRASMIVQNVTGTIRFVHDKIQEAAMALVPSGEYNSLQFQVGMILYKHLSPEKLQSMMFVVANLLNSWTQKSIEIAEVNLRAAAKAMDILAFPSVAHFARTGIANIDAEEMWESHFDLALGLHSYGALAEKNLGNVEASEKYCSTVIDQKKATPLQKSPVWHVKLQLLHNQGRLDEALELGVAYLRELGCEFPKRKILRQAQAGPYMQETRRKYIPSAEDVNKMPVMTDPVKIETLKILEETGSLAYMAQDGPLYIMIRCRFVRLVMKHGLTDDAASAFASFANVAMHKHGYFELGMELAKLSLIIQETRGSKFSEARTLANAHGYVLGWFKPLQSRLRCFLQGYNAGMLSGNIFSACICLVWYLLAEFQSGTKLALVEEDCRTYIPQLDRLKIYFCADLARPMWQLVQNLRGSGSGSTQNTTTFTGDAMDEDQFRKNFRAQSLEIFDVQRCLVCMFFGEYEKGTEIALQTGIDGIKKAYPGVGFGFQYIAFGICFYAMARKTKLPKYKRQATLIRTELQSLVKKGCLNLQHHLSLLDAEHHAINGRSKQAIDSYVKASQDGARRGFLQDAAIAHERHADFLLQELKDPRDAAFRLEQAIEYYDEWGAVPKANQLREKRDKLRGDSKRSDGKS